MSMDHRRFFHWLLTRLSRTYRDMSNRVAKIEKESIRWRLSTMWMIDEFADQMARFRKVSDEQIEMRLHEPGQSRRFTYFISKPDVEYRLPDTTERTVDVRTGEMVEVSARTFVYVPLDQQAADQVIVLALQTQIAKLLAEAIAKQAAHASREK